MKHSCQTCEYGTRLDKDANPIDKKDTVVLGYYCGVTRLKFLFDIAPEDCPEWDEASKERYPE